MRRSWWLVAVALLGCSKAREPVADDGLRIALGDCAAVELPFVSGPRPRPFDPAALVVPKPGARHDHGEPDPDHAPVLDRPRLIESGVLVPIAAEEGGRGDGAPARPPGPAHPANPAEAELVPYRPGAQNPLRGHEPAIAACLRKQPHKSGVLVLDLSFAPAGAVTQAAAHGTPDQATRSCIAAAAQQHGRSEGGAPRRRCSLAFGTLPVAGAPGVELAIGTISWNGTPVARPKHADASPGSTLEPLYAAAKAFVAAPNESVAIRGPVMLRAHDTTQMDLVNLAARSLAAAGVEDVVYAAQDGASWRPLVANLELPVVPVPVGTGGRWYGRGRGPLRALTDDEPIQLAMVVQPLAVWLVVSRTGEAQRFAATGGKPDPAAIAQALRAHKASAVFADRADLQIAGEGSVTYRTVLDAIAHAEAAGFVEATLMDPTALSARPQR